MKAGTSSSLIGESSGFYERVIGKKTTEIPRQRVICPIQGNMSVGVPCTIKSTLDGSLPTVTDRSPTVELFDPVNTKKLTQASCMASPISSRVCRYKSPSF